MTLRHFKLILVVIFAAVLLASCTQPVPAEPSADPTERAETSSHEESAQETPGSDTKNTEMVTESDSGQNFNRFNAQLTKSGNTVYFFNSLMGSNHYMRFADLTSGVSGPLCGEAGVCP